MTKNTKGYKITFSTTNRGEQVEYFFRGLQGLTLEELVSVRLQQLKDNSYVISDSIKSGSATRTLSGATSINLLT